MNNSQATLDSLSAGIEREMQAEEEALNMGITQYRERTTRLQQQGLETANDYGHKLLARSVEPFAAALVKFLEEAKTKPGRKHIAAKYLGLIEPDVAAVICARVVYDGITQRRAYQGVALEVGGRIEDEVRFRSFEQEKPGLYKTVVKNLDNHPMGYQKGVRRSTMVHAANKFGVAWAKWSKVDKVHVGSKLIDLFIESVGLVRLHHSQEVRNTMIYLEATEELTKWITEYAARAEVFAPLWMPMICPPNPWTNPSDGGYYHHRFKSKLVKARVKGYLTELAHREMPLVYDAVNSLQETPWKINGAMLTLVKEIWEAGLEVKGLPSRLDAPLPAKPANYETNVDSKKAWKAAAADVFRNNLRSGSKRLQAAKIMWLAERFAEEKAIWFPVQLDFRGRMYHLPQYLNPQGCDLAKGLLTFAVGKKLGKDGVFWLAMHIANCFGYDKVSLAERVEWTKKNSDRIFAMANDPVGDLWWTEADKPFQFLAACVEWIGYLTDGGENYECSLPILVDGSCNGIQHFSAMLRDEVAGTHVNLVPADKPADIYQEVANQMQAFLRTDAVTSGKNAGVSGKWVEYGITRKMCKRPVMVLPYGGGREAFRKYLLEYVGETVAETKTPHPFEDARGLSKAINHLTSVLTDTMKQVIRGPRDAMDWLKEVSRVVSKEGLPVVWSTPSGFLVQQAYPELKSKVVETRIGDKVVKVSITEEQAKLDARKQSQAISPNFVHSLDASALVLTIVNAAKRGITQFAAIHDSYGTLAADLTELQSCLRESFVAMYQDHDVLAEFSAEVGAVLPEGKTLPELPPKGNLDLTGVLSSDFFFA